MRERRSLSVGPIFTVLPITSSFLVRFRPVKYWIEALDVIYPMVRRWSAKSCFWSGQGLGQTWSTSVNFGQTQSNLVKPSQTSRNVFLVTSWGFLSANGPLSGQTSLTWVTSFCVPTHEKGLGVKIGLWQLPTSLFGVVWHKERWTKNKWLNFYLFRFSYFSCSPLDTVENFPRFACHSLSDVLALNQLTHGSKVKGGFQIFIFVSKLLFFPTSAFSFSSLLAQISQSGSSFAFLFAPFFEQLNFFNFLILFDLSAHLANTLVHKMHLCIKICTRTNGYL